jgi:hypothetical protein
VDSRINFCSREVSGTYGTLISEAFLSTVTCKSLLYEVAKESRLNGTLRVTLKVPVIHTSPTIGESFTYPAPKTFARLSNSGSTNPQEGCYGAR